MGVCPCRLFGVGTLLNNLASALPLVRWLGIYSIAKLRPCLSEASPPSISIIIPARNERGNIESALKRIPRFQGAKVEIILVEGHSSDGTWQEIQRCLTLAPRHCSVKAYQQLGQGKGDAVRLGFEHASHDLLTILDADLSTPPELLEQFYAAYCLGMGDFINRNRLVYPIEGHAMRPLNHLGNLFFARALSKVLEVSLGDTLCGTKLFARHDYARFKKWREKFGDFDPFGDFELLFPAAVLGLGIVDVPLHYRDRRYGSTNIHRFRHGAMLLRMVVFGFFRVLLRFDSMKRTGI
ncbi:MAG: glycosyltransferase family 2 protein [Proteobacteria bacterium]|nr:glycosyltransferase family 2 protein [Pseudomonadota bacterium]